MLIKTRIQLNSIEFLVSTALIDSNISHGEFILTNDVLKEYEQMKEEIENWKTESVYWRF